MCKLFTSTHILMVLGHSPPASNQKEKTSPGAVCAGQGGAEEGCSLATNKILAEVERIVAESAGIVDPEASRVGRCWDCIRKWHNRG